MGGTRRIALRRRDKSVVAHALINAADYPLVAGLKWHLKDGYACHALSLGEYRIEIPMHRLILGLQPYDGLDGDHINRNRLDNRRANLRTCTRAEQGQNVPSRKGTSRYRGVYFNSRVRRWHARVNLHGHRHHLGYFDNEAEAGAAARRFRVEHMPLAVD